jgi:hypothetical protein
MWKGTSSKIWSRKRDHRGVSLAVIRRATGFLSTAAKEHGLKIESTKTEVGGRVYQANPS